MTVPSDLIRGNTDMILLSCLSKGDTYGYQINKTVLAATDDAFSFKDATLYSAFRRLESQGFIASYWGDDEEPGARRRYYTITDKGKKYLARLREEWSNLCGIMEKLT